MSSASLCTDDKISYASLMLCSFYPEVDISETGHVRSRSTAFLKNRKTIRKAPIMESKNLFTGNLLSTAVDFSIRENEKFWKLQ